MWTLLPTALPKRPESSWDECSFTIMNVIRGFKTAQQQGNLAISQQQAYQQRYGGQYQQQHGGYYTHQPGTFQQLGTFQQTDTFQQQQPGTFQQPGTSQPPGNFQQKSGTFHPPGNFQQKSGTFQPPGNFQQQSGQDGATYSQLTTVSSSVLGAALNTSVGLDTSLSNLLSTSRPVQSPEGRQQLDTTRVTTTTTAATATTASVPVTQSGDKPGGRVEGEDSG